MSSWIHNLLVLPEQVLVNYLRKRGWVVFYLDERSRECRGDMCWLKLYQSEESSVYKDA